MWFPFFVLIYFVSSIDSLASIQDNWLLNFPVEVKSSTTSSVVEETTITEEPIQNEHSNTNVEETTENEKPLKRVPLQRARQAPDIDFRIMGMRYCKIPKASSTMTRAILCDLYRRYRKIPFKQTFNEKTDYYNECQVNHWYHNEPSETKAWEIKEKNETKFAVIRHPVDRFVSIYAHLCNHVNLCQGVGIEKFAEQVYLMMLKDEKPNGMSETDFKQIKYHAQPQTWFCDIRKKPESYHFVRFSLQKALMERDFLKVFTQAGIPKRFSKEALRHLHKSNTSHANDREKSAELRKSIMKSKRAMRFIRATFHSDFELLHFKA